MATELDNRVDNRRRVWLIATSVAGGAPMWFVKR